MTGAATDGERGWDPTDDRARAAFGPFDSMRTLSELQAQGIRAATDIAHRLTALIDVRPPSPPGPQEPAGARNGRPAVGELRDAVGRLIDLYGDVLQRTFDAYAELLEQRARMGPRLDGGPAETVRVDIVHGKRDGVGNGELWLTNDTDAATARLRLVASPLVRSDGYLLTDAVALDPSAVDVLEPGASTRVAVTIQVDPGTPAGYYHGYVLVPELPGEALPLTLSVGPTGHDGPP
jgi:hypothetical protein